MMTMKITTTIKKKFFFLKKSPLANEKKNEKKFSFCITCIVIFINYHYDSDNFSLYFFILLQGRVNRQDKKNKEER